MVWAASRGTAATLKFLKLAAIAASAITGEGTQTVDDPNSC